MLMPTIPIVVVLGGFHVWRRICPLAQIGELGALVWRRGPTLRRLDPFVMPASLVVLTLALVIRLLITNGDGCALACMLTFAAAAAIVVNATFGGRAWCNYLCPVGVVERIYTDGGHLRRTPTSRCRSCGGCKRSCPDVDPQRAYTRELLGIGRRVATMAFPGLVLAFYGYFRLRAGSWDAYFDGHWTHHPASAQLLWGPGFAFAPHVPAVIAAPLTLVVGMLVSAASFASLERVLGRRLTDRARCRHVVLSLASFCAFALFYVFAGQPTLLELPYGSSTVSIVLAALGAYVLYRRLRAAPELPQPAAHRVALPVLR
jgi:hypothetical protein